MLWRWPVPGSASAGHLLCPIKGGREGAVVSCFILCCGEIACVRFELTLTSLHCRIATSFIFKVGLAIALFSQHFTVYLLLLLVRWYLCTDCDSRVVPGVLIIHFLLYQKCCRCFFLLYFLRVCKLFALHFFLSFDGTPFNPFTGIVDIDFDNYLIEVMNPSQFESMTYRRKPYGTITKHYLNLHSHDDRESKVEIILLHFSKSKMLTMCTI